VIDVAVVLAGALGAVTRFGLDSEIKQRVGDRFPVGILVVNLSGSLVVGLVVGLILAHRADEYVRAVLGVGFCGGYTTFSTFAFDSAQFTRHGRVLVASGYIAATVFGSVAAAVLGLMLTGAW
jgi:CrcB protein